MSRPISIKNSTTGLCALFTYNDDYDRVTMQVKQGENETLNKYYFGGGKYEIETVNGIENQKLYLDGSPYTASIILEKTGAASPQTYYLHHDYLGSITQISDNNGNLAAEYSYDAWGRMRNVNTWQPYAQGSQPTPMFGRGYTGHEHLNDFGLINMNARLYDPLLARFLSPDPFVGSGMTNDFNRYVYCSNNPLKYTDPKGEWSFEIGLRSGSGLFYKFSNGNSGFYGNYNTSTGSFVMGSTYYGYQTSSMIYVNENQHNQFNSASHVLTGHYYTTVTTGWIEHGYKTTPTSLNFNLTSTLHDVYADYSNKDFFGVPLEFMSGNATYNSYILSKIRTDVSTYEEYIKKGLNSRSGQLLMHEFGHHLQEIYYGTFNYYWNVVPTSGMNCLLIAPNPDLYKKDPVAYNEKMDNYNHTWTETEANTLSYDYFGRPSYWDFKEYPIDTNLLHLIIHK